MTALAALWSPGGGEPGARCARMLAAQAIYGPDGAAQAGSGPVTLGRRLFRLTAQDDLDRGPVRGGDGTLLMAADVRIDNRADLAAALAIPAPVLAGLSDPALLMRAVERWGTEGLAAVVGPFALILWDERAGALILARDPLGERPLHYHRGEGFVAVASMPKGLHALPEVGYAADPAAMVDFLAFVPETGEDSFFAGVSRVLPGHCVTFRGGEASTAPFWTWPTATLTLARDEDYVEATRAAFDLAVRRRLRVADGGVAAHLSGGLDSSGVAATAARLLAPQTLFAFTAVPSVTTGVPHGTIADEGPLAAQVAAMHPNIEHVRLVTSPVSPLSLLDRHFQVFERPVLNPSNAVWGEAIATAARARGARVLLTGQMGNLTISHAGMQRLPELVRHVRPLALARLAWQLSQGGARWRTIGAAAIGPFLPRSAWEWIDRTFATGAPLSACTALREEAIADAALGIRAGGRGLDFSYRPWRDGRAMRLWGLSRVDMGVYNKGMLAGWGVDLRDPTADRDLIALCLSIPERQYSLDGVPRSLARRVFADRLPAAVAGERRRGFQAADWHVGLAGARSAIAVELDSLDRSPVAARLIDTDRLRASLADWPDGGWNERDRLDRYRSAMLRGVAAGHFLRRVARTN